MSYRLGSALIALGIVLTDIACFWLTYLAFNAGYASIGNALLSMTIAFAITSTQALVLSVLDAVFD
jgi:hypothetical protein